PGNLRPTVSFDRSPADAPGRARRTWRWCYQVGGCLPSAPSSARGIMISPPLAPVHRLDTFPPGLPGECPEGAWRAPSVHRGARTPSAIRAGHALAHALRSASRRGRAPGAILDLNRDRVARSVQDRTVVQHVAATGLQSSRAFLEREGVA